MTRLYEPQPPSDPLLRQQLGYLRSAIVHKPPFCQGLAPLSVDDLVLFYGKGPGARRINLLNASPEELQHLAEACDPATFGLDQQDVYDETYRKAGKLDHTDFALVNFSPDAAGLLDEVRNELLIEGLEQSERIRAELYKLNVYGPGSFFKAHVDTPRSELMFGSLVIVFPTAHEGGALVLRQNKEESDDSEDDSEEDSEEETSEKEDLDDDSKMEDAHEPEKEEWTFDSSALLSSVVQTGSTAPTMGSVAYIAFYSDVEHEVLPVRSGYRVTVTYNLYYEQDSASASSSGSLVPRSVPMNEQTFRSTFRTLLDDPTFLPTGGNLLFTFLHQYPLPKGRKASKAALKDVGSRLKGSDAVIMKVVQELGLQATLGIVYRDVPEYRDVTYILCDQAVPLEGRDVWSESLHEYLEECSDAVLLNPNPEWERLYKRTAQVHWIATTPWQFNSNKETFVAHGNEATLSHTYWRISMLVRVGAAGSRTVVVESDSEKSEQSEVEIMLY
ncbi:hypothetical protein GY45DRAFT_1334446 [Cubamyces sp. BRFM 1775]|nr:hypothetical protein GY45DRAFT_1334446 [Cubamyces sp. BRFM 1775]